MWAIGDAAWVGNRIAVALMIGNLDQWSCLCEVACLQIFAGTHKAIELLLKGLEVANFLFGAELKDFFDKDVDELETLPETTLHALVLQG